MYGNQEGELLYLERMGSVFAVQIIHCTKKLINELDVSPSGSMAPEPLSGILGHWHANLIRIERRKCLLLTNDRMLYSFLVPGVKKKDLVDFRELFALHLKMNLAAEGFGPEDIAKALREYDEIAIAPSASGVCLAP